MKLNKILSAALAAGMIFSLAACDGDNGNSDKGNNSGMTKIILPDYDLKKDDYELTISGWLIPSTIDETNVKWINESGISTLFAIGAGDGVQSFYSYDEKAEKTLTLLGNNGVKVYVNPGVSDGTAYRKISEFKQSDAVLGICVDEPNKSQMTSMAAQVDWWNQNSDGRNFYSNLFPSFAQVVQKEFDGNYSDYLKFYCDNVLSKLTSGEKWLSADRYPLTYNENGEKQVYTAADLGVAYLAATTVTNIPATGTVTFLVRPYAASPNGEVIYSGMPMILTYVNGVLQTSN